jgi:BolA family transcriptional regulator, general stress-responsive regulator|tara:strand:- start:2399 stop:2659 length:261 start_codon:yes stop_codon:yes gene_type:complete
MNISELITIIKSKLQDKIIIENIEIEDKSFLHKNHKSHEDGKFHIKILIESSELTKFSNLDATKKIYNILDKELKENIHSIQILFN